MFAGAIQSIAQYLLKGVASVTERGGSSMDRRRTAALLIGGVVATALLGVVVGGQISSPAEEAARTAPPEASPILVPIEERVLSADVVTRGTGRFGSPAQISVAASALKPAPGFVAEVRTVGTDFEEGSVLLIASGRPIFMLEGAQSLARDLGPGMSGDDVRQLEEALQRLGIATGAVDGVYDDATQQGVAAWYEEEGFSPFTATPDQLATIRTREAELTVARLEILTANDSVGTADAAVAAAQSALTTAQNRSNIAVRDKQRAESQAATDDAVAAADVAGKQAVLDAMKSGSVVPAPAADIAVAQADLETARANATSVSVAAGRAVADAQAVLDGASDGVATATQVAASANAVAQAGVDAKQAALDDVLANPATTPTQEAAARADLAAAQANADNVSLVGEQSVADAQSVLDDAPAALDAARTEGAAAVAVAEADVAAKKAVVDALTNPGPATPSDRAAAEADLATAMANQDSVRLAGEQAVDQATIEVANVWADVNAQSSALATAWTARTNAEGSLGERASAAGLAQQEADLAHRQAGIQVPADEVVFVPTATVKLSEMLVVQGDPAVGGLMLVTDSQVFVDGSLAVEDAGLVEAGATVELDEASLGIATEGVISFVAPGPGTNGVDGFHVYFEASVSDPPPNLVGASVRLTIPVTSTGGTVLAVPVSALTMGADGSSRVQVDTTHGLEIVEVTPGLSADGYVEITPVGDEVLNEGELVLIGFDGLTTSSQPAEPTSTDPTDTGASNG